MSSNRPGERVSIYLPSLNGGGAERAMLYLANGLVERRVTVDVVLAKAEGPYLENLAGEIRVIDLKEARVTRSFPGLVGYLRREHPRVLLSSMDHANIVALWARAISRARCGAIVNVQNTVSQDAGQPRMRRERLVPHLIRRFYPWADWITTVSKGVADDLIRLADLPEDKVRVVFNPVVTPDLMTQAAEAVDHPWFGENSPPVILGVGRLTRQKNFPLLLRSFARIRRSHPCRLMILGEGEERSALEALVRELGLGEDVALPGYVRNPYAYMARAGMFTLSSLWEGLPTVLIEAGAVGAPLVATDCPSGPREILDGGRFGKLISVNDLDALSNAMIAVLEGKFEKPPESYWHRFSQENSVKGYLELLEGFGIKA